MNSIILITGQTQYQINLDPSIWIFDERRFPLHDRLEGCEGLAIELSHFLAHAKPDPHATHLKCHRKDQSPSYLDLNQAETAYLRFAIDDQPLANGGPIHLFFADGSNQSNPIDDITQLEVVTL